MTAVGVLAAPHGADADELYERTGGNPFFVTEALASPGEEIPTTVRLAVLARAGRLDAATRAVVDAVAVVPGRAESWLVAAMSDAPAAGLDSAVAAGVLVRAGDDVAFRHELARRAIEDDLSAERRRIAPRQGARRPATARRCRPGTARPPRPGRRRRSCARHRGDGTPPDWPRSRTAHEEAVRFGEIALGVRGELEPDEVAELAVDLVNSLTATARSEDAAALAAEAVEHWRASGDTRRETHALVALAQAINAQGRPLEAQPMLEQAVALLEQHPPGPELALAYLRLTSLTMLARDRDSAVRWGERAIALATRLGELGLLGRALVETGIADVMDGRFDGLRRVREGIDLGRRHDLPGVVDLGLSADRIGVRRDAPLRRGGSGARRGSRPQHRAPRRGEPSVRRRLVGPMPLRPR